MKIFSRSTGKEIIVDIKYVMESTGCTEEQATKTVYKRAIRMLYHPSYSNWLNISNVMQSTMDEFKNAKLVKYKMTEQDKKRVAENPDAILDIPRYYIPKLDKKISSDAFESSLKKEFFDRFLANDPEIIKMVNSSNKMYRVEA